jgi:hypothetical protein
MKRGEQIGYIAGLSFYLYCILLYSFFVKITKPSTALTFLYRIQHLSFCCDSEVCTKYIPEADSCFLNLKFLYNLSISHKSLRCTVRNFRVASFKRETDSISQLHFVCKDDKRTFICCGESKEELIHVDKMEKAYRESMFNRPSDHYCRAKLK